MELLNDEKLCEYIKRAEPLVKDLKPRTDWFDKDSPVQPSSIDLHIGSIFIPGTKHGMEGSEDEPLATHTLGPGETAIITTLETLELPANIAAIGFPPSRISVQGLLMKNPGHVDPGYKGQMHFAVINMGREEFSLRNGAMIVRLLFFEMSSGATKDYAVRTGPVIPSRPKQEDINRLSKDFLDVTNRAESLARKEVADAGLRLEQFRTRERMIVAIMSLLVLLAGWVGSWLTGAKELEGRVQKLEKAQAVTDSSLSLDRRVTALEMRSNPQQPPTAGPGATSRRGASVPTQPPLDKSKR